MTARPPFRIVERTTLNQYAFLGVEQCTVESSNGDRFDRVVITHPGAVAIVPVIDDEIVLIRQYRVAADRDILEIPAGKLDGGDATVEIAAARELAEETGFTASSFTTLTAMWTAVGFSDERITILLAQGLKPGTASPEGAEEIAAEVVRMPFTEAVTLVINGEITDSKTIAGIMIADAHRRTT